MDFVYNLTEFAMKKDFSNVEEYISKFPPEVRIRLEQMRNSIRSSAPGATEEIAYGMPAYKLNGRPLVYFAAFKSHIGFYATPSGHEAFSAELSKYKQGRGSVQFPLNQPLPLDLVRQITEFRVAENLSFNPKKKSSASE
jgi:uncharacterized protein YdhG (YjbR/CyaY superfamily)